MLFLPDYVDDQISNVFSSLLIAIGIVMVVVLFGIGFRNSLLIVITIPIIVFATIAILNAFDMELHKLSIVGLIVSIGILVDNQIVITEGIKRNIEKGLKSDLSSKVSIKENIWPVLSSSLTTIAAFLVIAILPGFLGEIVRSMPLTVIITISLSFIVSMSLSPVLATVFLRISKKKKSKSVHEQRIKSMISFTIKFPKIWILISVVLFAVSSYFAFTTLDIDLYPNDERSILYIDFEGDINNQESTTLIHDEIIEELNTNSDVLNYSSSIGGDLPNFHFSSKLINEQPHIGRIYVNLDYNEKELLDYADELELDLKEINNRITVNTIELSPPIPPMRVIVSNKDKEVLSTESNLLYSELNDLDYVKTISIQESVIAPKFIINYDIDEMNSSFISKIEVDSIIAANLNGLDLSFFSYNNNHIVVNIDTDIVSMNDILELPITSSTTSISYTLDDFVSISSVDDYALITRQNGIPISIIDVYPDGIDNFELEDNIEKLRQTNNLNKSTFDYSGENQMFEEISTDLIRASIIALVLIFIIMFIQFNNFVKPLIVYLTIPLSFTGSFLFLLAFNQAITATSLIGMVSLIGVTVNTGILLVEYISREFEKTNDLKQACINSVYLRFRPIMLTSVTTILGLIPLLITGGNFFRPLAITFMGGLVTSTIITIFLVPSFYYMIYKNKKTS